jgi:RNA polymerase sigma factor (sigma-70 family)
MPRSSPSPSGTSGGRDEFEQQWCQVREGIWRYCLWAAGSRTDAEDLFQTVALRAWRGYATFKGESSFATWVGSIARNEASRLRMQLGRRRESGIDEYGVAAAAEAAAQRESALRSGSDSDRVLDRMGSGWVSAVTTTLLDDAVLDGVVSPGEAAVVRARAAADPPDGWDVIGSALGLTDNHCAVLHSRARTKLAVYVFCRHPALLGGPDAVREAFRAARTGPNPLTDAECEAFELVVLGGRAGYRRKGWQGHLRAAVAKVAAHARLAEW